MEFQKNSTKALFRSGTAILILGILIFNSVQLGKIKNQNTAVQQLGELKTSNSVLTSLSEDFARAQYAAAEDLFNPCTSGNAAVAPRSNALDISGSLGNEKLKVSNFKLRAPHENEKVSDHLLLDEKDSNFVASNSMLRFDDYDEVAGKYLSAGMKAKLDNMRYIFEYNDPKGDGSLNGLYVQDADKGVLNGYVSSEFIVKEITENKINYIVKGKYDLSIIDNSSTSTDKVKYVDHKFSLVKENGKWVVGEFESAAFDFSVIS